MGNTEKRNETPVYQAIKAKEINAAEETEKEAVSAEADKSAAQKKSEKTSSAKEDTKTAAAATNDTEAKNNAESKDNAKAKQETAAKGDAEAKNDTAAKDDAEAKSNAEAKQETAAKDDAEAKDDTEAKKSEGGSEDSEDEDIVFAGDDGGDTGKSKKEKKTKRIFTPSPAEQDDESEIVFAVTDKKQKKTRIPKQKKRVWPAVVTAAVLVACAGAGAAVWGVMNNQAKVSTEQSAAVSDTPAGPEDLSVVSKAPEQQASAADPSEEKPDVSEIDTTNIFFGQNVTVEGIDLSGKTLAQSYDTMQDKLLEIREPIAITIVCDGKPLTLTQNDFDFDTNLSEVLIEAYHYSRGEITDTSVEKTEENGKTNFKVHSEINTKSVEATISKAAAFYDVQPVDAHVTSFDPNAAEKFTYADGSDGFLLNHDELSEKIKGILDQGEKKGSFSIEKHLTPFKVSLPEIKANTKLIASHYTSARNVYASNENMKLALRAASGTVVKPGETFSFNEMTGDTTNGNMHHYANGVEGAYVPSKAYVQGESEDQYGGGICQAATTLYICAMKANMEAVERHAHMFTVSYSPYGLDATIDYGNLDMRFKNNFDLPVYIATYVYDYNGDGYEELLVEMYGPLSTEYDEVVPIGWVTYADSKNFSAMGAKVYFKDGKEIDRVFLPRGSYELHYETYYTVINYMPSDINFGPGASPTYSIPSVYSPNGCGSSAPISYGTADQVLKAAKAEAAGTNKKQNESSKSSGTVVVAR